jgi:uncharacterized protein (DUF58 family)
MNGSPDTETVRRLLARVRRIEITAQRLVNESLAGRYHSVFKGRGMSFDEVRPYAAGDEVRLIDWNVSARTGEVFVKQFVEERELTVVVVADASASMDFGLSSTEYRTVHGTDRSEDTKREVAAQVAAAIALSAQMNNDRVGLLTFGAKPHTFIAPRKGRQHALRVIREVLAMEAPGETSNLAAALSYLGKVLKRRAVLFIVSDFEVSDFERELRVAARRHDVHALILCDPVEDRLPEGGIVPLQDLETGALSFVHVTNRYLDRLADVRRRRRQALDPIFKRLKVPFTDFSTGKPYDRLLAAHFARLKGKAL